jgi:hypothetical protein
LSFEIGYLIAEEPVAQVAAAVPAGAVEAVSFVVVGLSLSHKIPVVFVSLVVASVVTNTVPL